MGSLFSRGQRRHHAPSEAVAGAAAAHVPRQTNANSGAVNSLCPGFEEGTVVSGGNDKVVTCTDMPMISCVTDCRCFGSQVEAL